MESMTIHGLCIIMYIVGHLHLVQPGNTSQLWVGGGGGGGGRGRGQYFSVSQQFIHAILVALMGIETFRG